LPKQHQTENNCLFPVPKLTLQLGGILKERMLEEDGYASAMRRALARKPFLKTAGRYLSREEVHRRVRLR